MINSYLPSIFNYASPFEALFSDLLDSDFGFIPMSDARVNYPVNVYDDSGTFVIDLACVGLDKNDIDISLTDNYLRIKYDKKDDQKGDNTKYMKHGITRKSFDFGWKIPDDYDVTKLEASLEKGELIITIPSAEKAVVETKKIEIK